MIIAEFIAKWRKADLKERSAAQEHFIDLCTVFEHPTPAAADPTGESFCFEKGISKHGGGNGFADVWKRGYFGWEYKGKHKDLSAAYDQLLRYRDALENPPLLVLCDLDRIIVRTNFTGTVSVKHEIALESLGQPRNVEIMRAIFHNPESLRPGRTSTAITQDAARRVAEIAAVLRERGDDPAMVAHFLDRIVFCLFAEDAGLLPENVFTRILDKAGSDSDRLQKFLAQLFESMATGGDFGLESIRHFNGSLFEDPIVLELTSDDVKRLSAAAALDWSFVDPSIFGTLFERGLDPAKRSQLGAHFTGIEDIELVVDAIIMEPLRKRWDETRSTIESLLTTGKKVPSSSEKAKPLTAVATRKAQGESSSILHSFLTELQRIKILDPACGSGNFLYVSLLRLKDLEKEVILYGADNDLGAYLPLFGPWQLYGIEINPYAHDLAQMTVWIGWLQWIRVNGFGFPAEPILRSLSNNIRLMDAIIQDNGDEPPSEPEWPTVDYIVGNPPFLAGNRIRQELGDNYVERLFKLYAGRVPAFSDLCCYWFEKARAHIETGKAKRVGLLATQGIRGGANRETLKRIKETGGIFWAESDRPWILDGANVHVSIVGFDDGQEKKRILDGSPTSDIHSNLTSGVDITTARILKVNQNIAFQGPSPKAPFDISKAIAADMLSSAGNPNGHPNSDIVRPVWSAVDIGQGSRGKWTIDFAFMSFEEAAPYERPFEYVRSNILPVREKRRDDYRGMWWQYARPRPEMRIALREKPRYISTPRVSKHRQFIWLDAGALANDGTIAFACADDLFFGILHSRFHELWALAQGTQLREKESGFRYTPTTCFETFPFPPGVLDGQPQTDVHDAIAKAAMELNELRENWLNPPEWTKTETLDFQGTVGGPWDRYIDPATVEDRGSFRVGTVRYPRIVPRDDESAAKLKKRTLTNLYNQRPAWLVACHARLDATVATAYGWPIDLTEEVIIEKLLDLNHAMAART